MKEILRTWLLAAVMTALVGVIAPPDRAIAQVTFTGEMGTQPNGTPYMKRVPSNWKSSER